MRKAIITGSFDPITSGHADLIERAAGMFDEVYVVILANTEKKSGLFSAEDRLAIAKALTDSVKKGNVRAVLHSGLTSDIARELGASFIVRGARSGSDFDYEYNLACIMKRFAPEIETVILPCSPELSAISSTYVRDLLKYGCNLGDAVPDSCRELIIELYNKQK